MRFLTTLMWMAIAVVCAIFSVRNWNNVTLDLWGPLQADIKVPLLMAIMFLLGFVPIWLVMRGKLWAARRKLIALERPIVTPAPPPLPTEETPVQGSSDD
jgi:putative membrane protein